MTRALPPLLFVVAASFAAVASACSADEDCSLNGVCSPSSSSCVCDAGWVGADCGALDLQPATRGSGYNLTGPPSNTSSWGGHIVRDPKDAGLFHLFAAEFTGQCGLDYWSPMSRIIRAESRSGPTGPYAFAAEVAGTFAHNPQISFDASTGLYLLYHIGCATPQPAACAAPPLACDAGNDENGESGITLRTSADLRSWTLQGQVLSSDANGTWQTDVTNPSPFVLPGAEGVLLFYRGCPWNCAGPEVLGFATAPSAAGPFERQTADGPIFANPAEDPFVWIDKRGNVHVLMHSLEPGGGWGGGPKVGRHGFARSLRSPWIFNNATLAFNTTVHFTDASTTDYYRRERPQLFFSDDGAMTPLLLTSGVQEVGQASSYTLIQPIGGGGVTL